MITLKSEATELLVKRLQGSRIKAELVDAEIKTVSFRIEEPTLRRIEQLVNETEGWSRNAVIHFLLWGGMELVEQQMKQHREVMEVE